jgi:hypothetical protein
VEATMNTMTQQRPALVAHWEIMVDARGRRRPVMRWTLQPRTEQHTLAA